jgi:hypothetical protein
VKEDRQMIEHTLDREHSILHVNPHGPLEKGDFEQLAKTVDPFIYETGGLTGLIIETPKFPGWKNFGAMVKHFKFVRDHHKKIRKVAVVTDSALGDAAEHIASHFVSAKIKHFQSKDLAEAKAWILVASKG